MLIDFRVRPPLPSFANQVIFKSHTTERLLADQKTLALIHRNRGEARSSILRSVDLMIEEMDDAGVTHAVIIGRDTGPEYGVSDNIEIAEFCSTSHNRFVGFAGINGGNPVAAMNEVRRVRSLGLRGVAFDNGFFNLHEDDSSLWPLYDAVAKEDLPIVLTSSMLLGPDLSYSYPEHIRTIAKKYPQTPIIVAHASWPWTTLICAVAFECPNLYLLPDCYLNMRAPGTDEYIKAANQFMPERLLYGSAYPVRPIGESVKGFKALPLNDAAMEGALWRNAKRLLSWPNA